MIFLYYDSTKKGVMSVSNLSMCKPGTNLQTPLQKQTKTSPTAERPSWLGQNGSQICRETSAPSNSECLMKESNKTEFI